ncbi:hypothetical protein STAS_05849 [Striga asiatica]|uniref:Uncharacterized protein n=1 Tax=Striga asiatica TaxID=4170 RepID=A0A5A7PB40_STRAF|nr:hypothetical protein STAS_05849 [Striga asiatica]
MGPSLLAGVTLPIELLWQRLRCLQAQQGVDQTALLSITTINFSLNLTNQPFQKRFPLTLQRDQIPLDPLVPDPPQNREIIANPLRQARREHPTNPLQFLLPRFTPNFTFLNHRFPGDSPRDVIEAVDQGQHAEDFVRFLLADLGGNLEAARGEELDDAHFADGPPVMAVRRPNVGGVVVRHQISGHGPGAVGEDDIHSSTADGEEMTTNDLQPSRREKIGPCRDEREARERWRESLMRWRWPIMGRERGLGGGFGLCCEECFLRRMKRESKGRASRRR